MDRTSAAGYTDIGGGRRGYRDRNLAGGIQGTTLVAADRNATQEELVGVIEAAGLTPAANDWGQLLEALRTLFAPHMAQLTGSGNWTVPTGITKVKVRGVAAGGGGQGSATTGGVGGSGYAGSGGGAGGYGEGVMTVTPGQVIAYNCGTGGAGATPGNAAGNGGDLSFGAWTLLGGSGAPDPDSSLSGGAGGGNGSGAWAFQRIGAYGEQGFTTYAERGGNGGQSPFGGRGRTQSGGGQTALQRTGSGGGGSYGGSGNGGDGADGCLILEW